MSSSSQQHRDRERDSDSPERKVTIRPLEAAVVVSFVGLNILLPFLIGEMYPITIAPMFSDQPTQYCQFEAWDKTGTPIALETLELQRNYDGNPTGLGVGIQPPATLDRFGDVPTEDELRDHLKLVLEKRPELLPVKVRCTVIGAISSQKVGPVPDRSFEVIVEPNGTDE